MIDDKIARQVVALGALLAVSTPAAAASLEQQGQYLAEAGGCAACHTAQDGQSYAGGRRIETPFGVLRSPNITPDEETGIGGLERGGVRQSPARGRAPRWRAALPGDALRLLYQDHR